MPVGRSSIGAFARTRVGPKFSTSKSLVPFLYQTPTIQQWHPAAAPVARRNASSRPDRDGDIPFDGLETLPRSIDDHVPARKTTVTGPERELFEKLYKKSSNQDQPQNGLPSSHDTDQIVDEWYEEDDDNAPASLDAVFEAVLAGRPPPGKHAKRDTARKPRETMKTLAQNILRPEFEEARRKPRAEAAAEAARIKALREENKLRVWGLMEQARTDRELWEILEREVFEKIRSLDLDGLVGGKAIEPRTKAAKTTESAEDKMEKENNTGESSEAAPKKRAFPTKPTATAWTPVRNKDPMHDPRILFPNFPSHLTHAAGLFRKEFPSSPLPLSILPTIKSLGRSSYALCATTALYNLLIRTVWIQYSSYDYIDELLTDMDNGGIEFDAVTMALLDEIHAEYEDARKGRFGVSLRGIYRMDHFGQGVNKIQNWKKIAMQRIGAWAEERASTGEVIRKYNFQGERGAARGRGPRWITGPADQFGFDGTDEEDVAQLRGSPGIWKKKPRGARDSDKGRSESGRNGPQGPGRQDFAHRDSGSKHFDQDSGRGELGTGGEHAPLPNVRKEDSGVDELMRMAANNTK